MSGSANVCDNSGGKRRGKYKTKDPRLKYKDLIIDPLSDRCVCKKCGKSLKAIQYFRRHVCVPHSTKKVKVREKTYCCHECGKLFFSLSGFRVHQTKHDLGVDGVSEYALEMDLRRNFVNEMDLNRHKELKHKKSGLRRCQCLMCGFSTTNTHYLKKHLKYHLGMKPYGCLVCEKRFEWVGYLKDHLKTVHHNVCSFTCEGCGKQFKRKSSLSYHNKTEHMQDRPYLCTECPKTFVTAHSLHVHIRSHLIVKKPKIKYTCHLCDSRPFTDRTCLTVHTASAHSDEKPFICDICGKAFKLKNGLRAHTQTHSNERPYDCEFCDRSFKLKKDLRKHQERHKSSKDYVCEICGKHFITRNDVYLHQKVHDPHRIHRIYRPGKYKVLGGELLTARTRKNKLSLKEQEPISFDTEINGSGSMHYEISGKENESHTCSEEMFTDFPNSTLYASVHSEDVHKLPLTLETFLDTSSDSNGFVAFSALHSNSESESPKLGSNSSGSTENIVCSNSAISNQGVEALEGWHSADLLQDYDWLSAPSPQEDAQLEDSSTINSSGQVHQDGGISTEISVDDMFHSKDIQNGGIDTEVPADNMFHSEDIQNGGIDTEVPADNMFHSEDIQNGGIDTEVPADNMFHSEDIQNGGIDTEVPADNMFHSEDIQNGGIDTEVPADNMFHSEDIQNGGIDTEVPADNMFHSEDIQNGGIDTEVPADNMFHSEDIQNGGIDTEVPADNMFHSEDIQNGGIDTEVPADNMFHSEDIQNGGTDTEVPAHNMFQNEDNTEIPAENMFHCENSCNSGSCTKEPADNMFYSENNQSVGIIIEVPADSMFHDENNQSDGICIKVLVDNINHSEDSQIVNTCTKVLMDNINHNEDSQIVNTCTEVLVDNINHSEGSQNMEEIKSFSSSLQEVADFENEEVVENMADDNVDEDRDEQLEEDSDVDLQSLNEYLNEELNHSQGFAEIKVSQLSLQSAQCRPSLASQCLPNTGFGGGSKQRTIEQSIFSKNNSALKNIQKSDCEQVNKGKFNSVFTPKNYEIGFHGNSCGENTRSDLTSILRNYDFAEPTALGRPVGTKKENQLMIDFQMTSCDMFNDTNDMFEENSSAITATESESTVVAFKEEMSERETGNQVDVVGQIESENSVEREKTWWCNSARKPVEKNGVLEVVSDQQEEMTHGILRPINQRKLTATGYDCHSCGMMLKTRCGLKCHMQVCKASRAAGKKRFWCEDCGRGYSTRSNLNIHQAACHAGDNKKFVCHLCGHACNDKQNLSRHIVLHSNARPFRCDMCQKCFKTREAVRSHLNKHLPSKVLYKCDECGMKYNHFNSLRAHERTHLTIAPLFICSICRRRMSDRSNLAAHIKRHLTPAKYSCPVCSKELSSPHSLQTHKGRACLKYQLKKDKDREKMERQLSRERVWAERETFRGKKQEEKKERSFCSVCHKQFGVPWKLLVHMTAHTSARHFLCDMCGQTFKRADAVKAHMKLLHSGKQDWKHLAPTTEDDN